MPSVIPTLELLALAPEAILAVGASVVGPLLAATRTVPVVFMQVTDPVGSGSVASLARPGGNATGFTLFEFGISAKWIALLKEIAPRVTRALVLLDPATATGFGQLGAIQSAAHSLGVEISPINIRERTEIEPAVAAVVRGLNDGLIVLPGPQTVIHRELIITVAARHRVPAVSVMGRTNWSNMGRRPATSIASSRARSRPTCRYRHPPSTSW